MSQNVDRKKQKHSYLSSHPQVAKKVTILKSPHRQKSSIQQNEYHKIRQQLYKIQYQMNQQLQTKKESLQHQNQMFSDSLSYFNPQSVMQQLQSELQQINQQDSMISIQISNCQSIQQNTSAEQYFLFKKNKRLQTFNQAMDLLFDEVNKEKEQMRQFMDQIRGQSVSVNKEVEDMQKELNQKSSEENNNNDKSSHKSEEESQVAQSKIQLTIESSHSSEEDDNNNNSNSKYQQQVQSDSSSQQQPSLDELTHLRQQYKTLTQTHDIIQQNNLIMSTQLVNNITTIEQRLNKHYEAEKTKLFREIMQLKEDFQYMPVQHIIPPSQTELSYHVAPLINDYSSKLLEVGKRLSSELKSVTLDILEPLRWEGVNFDEYLDSPRGRDYRQENRQSQASMASSRKQHTLKETKTMKQAQAKYDKLQQQLKKQDNKITELQNDLQQIMGETMIYKQKQHELQLAMNNMRKMIREQQKVY